MLAGLHTLEEKASTAAGLAGALGRHAVWCGRRPAYRATPPLRIAVEVSPAQIAAPSGMGRYIALLAEALLAEDPENEYTLLLGRSGPCPIPPGRARLRRLRFPVTLLERLAGRPRIEVAAGPIDLFHCQAGFTPCFAYGPLVATIHDVLPLLTPDAYEPGYLASLREHLLALSRSATRVITGSQAAAQDITAVLGVPPEKLRVVPHGPDPRFLAECPAPARAAMRQCLRLDGPYLLALGTVSPHKNHGRLVRAFAAIARDVPHTLVIAGRPDAGAAAVTEALQETGIASRVRLLGYTPGEHLAALLAEADLLAQPSLYEGFGLPVLDAMAAGTPVACANASALPEVAGDAAEYFDPRDVRSIADALHRVLTRTERRDALRAAGKVRAAAFSWAKAAHLTAQVYREAARTFAGG